MFFGRDFERIWPRSFIASLMLDPSVPGTLFNECGVGPSDERGVLIF